MKTLGEDEYTGMTKTQVLLFAWGKQFLSAFPVCTLLCTLQAVCLSTTISCIAIQELWNTNTMQTVKYKYQYKYRFFQALCLSPPNCSTMQLWTLVFFLHVEILFNKEPSRSPLHLAQGREDNLSKRLPIWDDNLGIGCPPEYGEITWA